jgi:branched-subunit amino acid aminotransferase/4-amino-4-deoxychorismate lyase
MSLLWHNGRLIPEAEARVPFAAHGLLYGDGVFETLRVYEGRAFRLERHLDRLFRGAGVIGLDPGWEAEAIAGALEELLAARALREAAARITALRGVGPPGPDPAGCAETLLFVTARPTTGYPERIYSEGARAIVASTRQNEHSPLCRVKSNSYLNHVLARAEARRAGADEAILLNSRGDVAEGALSNLFARCGDRLVTPSIESGCLPGIARAEVLELAAEVGLRAEECSLTLDELLRSDEALLTNSLLEVAPLVRLGDTPIGSGHPGEAAASLRRAYLARVQQSVSR